MNGPLSGYRSQFSHATERAEPGYYAVTLSDYDIRTELTATPRVGLHRYGFPAGKPAHVLVDLRSSIYDYPGKVDAGQSRDLCRERGERDRRTRNPVTLFPLEPR